MKNYYDNENKTTILINLICFAKSVINHVNFELTKIMDLVFNVKIIIFQLKIVKINEFLDDQK